MKRIFSLLHLILLLSASNFALAQQDSTRYGRYYFEKEDVVFLFNFEHYLNLIDKDLYDALEFADLNLKEVIESGTNLRKWSKNGWRLVKRNDGLFELRKHLRDFKDQYTRGFKFLLNDEQRAGRDSSYSRIPFLSPDIKSTVNPDENGNVKFHLDGYPNALQVILSGTFCDWDEHKLKMTRSATGWDISLKLETGNYEYKYIVDGEWINDPAVIERVPNEHGTDNTPLHVARMMSFILDGYTEAKEVYLSGAFVDWSTNKLPMTRTATGWQLQYPLNKGKHEYKFIVDGTWILDPANRKKERTPDGYVNSVIMVK